MGEITITRSNSGFFASVEFPNNGMISIMQKRRSELALTYDKVDGDWSTHYRGEYGEWDDFLNNILNNFDTPNKKLKKEIKNLIQVRKKWKECIPAIKKLCLEILKTDWKISVCYHKNNMLFDSKTLLWQSPTIRPYNQIMNCMSVSKLNNDLLDIVFDYMVSIDEELILCDCGTNHASCSRINPFK